MIADDEKCESRDERCGVDMGMTRRRFLGLAAGGAAAIGAGFGFRDAPGLQAPPGRWVEQPRLPWRTQEVYAAVRDGRIVVAGGMRSGASSSSSFETLAGTVALDPAEGAWTVGPELPAPRHHLVLATVGETVFGFGGFVGENLRTGFRFRGDVFALRDGGWSRVGEMPAPLGETVAMPVGGRVHLVTGSLHESDGPGGRATGRHLVYEPDSGSWSTARPAPTARSSATGGVVDGQLYVAGGRRMGRGVENLGALERYDPESDEWEQLRPLPQPAGGLAGTGLDGRLYCFGGERFGPDGGGVFRETWVYRPRADEWQELSPMRTPRHGLAAAAIDGRVYAIGGNTAPGVGARTSHAVEALEPSTAG